MQRSVANQAEPSVMPSIVHEVLESPGQPLDPATRAFMEPRFGHAFAALRTGPSHEGKPEAEAERVARFVVQDPSAVRPIGQESGKAHDFGRVRVHADARAAEAARAVNARAYTVGNHIVFGVGQHAPLTRTGRLLIAHELTHTLQQTGHGLTLQRQEAPASGPAEGTPSWMRGTIRDFCQPFASRQEAREAHAHMLQNFVPLDEAVFGPEVGSLWRSYLGRKHGESLARRVFADPSSRLVQGFVNSVTTRAREEELVERIKAALPSNCPTLAPGVATDIPVSRFLSRADLEFPINFNEKFEIPGHIAGGVGSSDAGPDRRQVSGHVTLRRDTDSTGRTTGVHLTTGFTFVVHDAIDFCPGDPGASEEQSLTIPLSRLEATGLFLQDEPFAYDVPFEVRYSGPPLAVDLDLATVRRCYPDVVPSQPTPPERPTPPPSPSGRREQRSGESR